MRKKWNNLVGRGLVLVLLVLFAVPCVACEDALGLCGNHGAHEAALSLHCTTPDCGCNVCGTPQHESSPCECVSDASKLRDRHEAVTPVMPSSVLPALSLTLPEPEPVRVSPREPDLALPPLLVRPAVPDRAPPTV